LLLFESEVCGSDAASSSNIYPSHNHHQFNSKILTSLIEKDCDSHTNSTSVDDCESLNSIENILTSIESMFKPSLLDLAYSHGVKCNTRMSSEELKNVLSDHLCKGCCYSSTYEGCVQITPILNNKRNEEDVDRSESNVRALLISHLSYLLPKIKLRPLRQLLSQHNILFSLQDNLSSLRRKLKAFINKKGKHQDQKEADRLAKEKEKEEQHESRCLEIHNS
jgi:hypothetical protein